MRFSSPLLVLLPAIGWLLPAWAIEPVRPLLTEGNPAPGKLVRQQAPEFRGTGVYHAIYLPINWQPGRLHPVIVEYAPNAWQAFSGKVDDCRLGFGLSGGRDFIWVVMPFVDPVKKENTIRWWGSEEATVEYCLVNLRRVCEQFGGDPGQILLTGFSRGAIATGYIGLRNDVIADVWLAFLPHSHIDGGNFTLDGAQQRLGRTRGRPTFITYGSEDDARHQSPKGTKLLRELGYPVVEREIPGLKHTDQFLETDSSIRREMRDWIADVRQRRPGTWAVRGKVVDSQGRGIAGASVQCGSWHWTISDAEGAFVIRSLVSGRRALTVTKAPWKFPLLEVRIENQDVALAPLAGE